MLGVQEPAYYALRLPEFSRRFAHKMRKLSLENSTKVFNSFCLPNEDTVHFPVAVLQPLNFDNLNEVGYVIGEGIEDRKDTLTFAVPFEPK